MAVQQTKQQIDILRPFKPKLGLPLSSSEGLDEKLGSLALAKACFFFNPQLRVMMQIQLRIPKIAT